VNIPLMRGEMLLAKAPGLRERTRNHLGGRRGMCDLPDVALRDGMAERNNEKNPGASFWRRVRLSLQNQKNAERIEP
jgi:hypothetical protein